jgi:hypothetical protein
MGRMGQSTMTPLRIRSYTRREGESRARACRAVPARAHATHASEDSRSSECHRRWLAGPARHGLDGSLLSLDAARSGTDPVCAKQIRVSFDDPNYCQ